MRRRQINKMRAAGLLPPVSLLEREAWQRQRETKTAPQKGVCGKCRKVIGRGVHFHERSCQG